MSFKRRELTVAPDSLFDLFVQAVDEEEDDDDDDLESRALMQKLAASRHAFQQRLQAMPSWPIFAPRNSDIPHCSECAVSHEDESLLARQARVAASPSALAMAAAANAVADANRSTSWH